mmetsp:Transcript_46760/g.144247  ORF Transcript_46760/g.144247 Transcript_46760/m.144247 type:complete len:232 (-) Transcript_46760:998-1693(-)
MSIPAVLMNNEVNKALVASSSVASFKINSKNGSNWLSSCRGSPTGCDPCFSKQVASALAKSSFILFRASTSSATVASSNFARSSSTLIHSGVILLSQRLTTCSRTDGAEETCDLSTRTSQADTVARFGGTTERHSSHRIRRCSFWVWRKRCTAALRSGFWLRNCGNKYRHRRMYARSTLASFRCCNSSIALRAATDIADAERLGNARRGGGWTLPSNWKRGINGSASRSSW